MIPNQKRYNVLYVLLMKLFYGANGSLIDENITV